MAISIFIILDNANIRSTRGSRHDPPIRSPRLAVRRGVLGRGPGRDRADRAADPDQRTKSRVRERRERRRDPRARARIAGLVRDLVVDEGSLVKRGQRLALVVDAKLKLGLAALDARLASLAGPVEAWPRRRSSGLGGCTVPATSARPASTRRWPTSMPSRPTQRPSRRSAPCWCSAAPRGAVLAPAAGRVLRVALTNGSVVMPGRDQHPAAQIGAHAGAPAAEHAAAHH